ncbi:MAG: hypothetical protein ACRDTM_13215 [Micromonosporaceae bacterium]
MRRTGLMAVTTAALIALTGGPAFASSPEPWEPAPSSPVTAPAGTRCDFAVRLEPIIDDVQRRVLERHPDGSVKREEYKGPLVDRVTNLDTGDSIEVNISGHAFVDYHSDGSFTWTWDGPVLMGFGAGQSNHAPGLYVLTGEYEVHFADGNRTVRRADGTEQDLCAALS